MIKKNMKNRIKENDESEGEFFMSLTTCTEPEGEVFNTVQKGYCSERLLFSNKLVDAALFFVNSKTEVVCF